MITFEKAGLEQSLEKRLTDLHYSRQKLANFDGQKELQWLLQTGTKKLARLQYFWSVGAMKILHSERLKLMTEGHGLPDDKAEALAKSEAKNRKMYRSVQKLADTS